MAADLFPWESEFDDDPIEFHQEDISFEFSNTEFIKRWIQQIISKEHKSLQHITFIFCSDAYLHDLNFQYLEHDTLTDVITFQYTALPIVEGDIFISIDRIKENANTFKASFEEELHRVMIHGVLHLCGYTDQSEEEKRADDCQGK